MASYDPPLKMVVSCQQTGRVVSNGIWFGDNPMTFSSPLFMMQLALCSVVMSSIHYVLSPLGQCSFVSQILGGIVLGPSVINHNSYMSNNVVNDKSLYVIRTFQYFGFMFFVFLVGLKTDMNMLVKSGRKAVMIGISAYIFPLLITLPISFILPKCITMDPKLGKSLPIVAVFDSTNSFHTVICLLAELKLLNSEIGRLAVCSSLMSGTIAWAISTVVMLGSHSVKGNADQSGWLILCFVLMIICVFHILRPMMYWMIRNTPEGGRINEFYVFLIFFMILISALVGEVVGMQLLIGPILLGIAVPAGPPLASALENKLHLIVSTMLLPLYYISHGSRVDVFAISLKNLVIVDIICFFALVGKIIGTILPCLYCNMSLQDATWLGVILSAQGIVDITYFRRTVQLQLINDETCSIMVLWAILICTIISPLLLYSYKPSKRFRGYRRTLAQIKSHTELRILACAFQESNAPSLISLLEACSPTHESPIYIYLLHLIELQGIAAPLLLSHQKAKKDPVHYNHSKHIINAFKFFEQHNQAIITVSPFTSITSYPTMHDDICNLAMEKKTNFIIIPFHRQHNADGILESSNSIRNVNRMVLSMAPCTVGLLIERGNSSAFRCSLGGQSLYRVVVVFLGGGDDREALMLGMRMAEHSNIQITVVRLLSEMERATSLHEKKLDDDLVNEFRFNYVNNGSAGGDGGRVIYKEEEVKDGVETIRVVQAMDKLVDMVIVGRQHGKETTLSDWTEFPELGYIGDVLVTSEANKEGAVLVIQQEMVDAEGLGGSPKAQYGGV